MNKNIILIFLILLAIIAGSAYLCNNQEKQNETAVRSVVEEFGKVLKNVSLLAPREILNQSLDQNYKDFLAPALLEEWKNDPSKSLGRFTSSPWPERIEIDGVEKISDESYLVQGYIIEMTSTGETTIKRHVALSVEKNNDRWLIISMAVGSYQDAWNIFSSASVEFQYPENLPAQYISTAEWPPKITFTEGPLVCQETPLESSFPLRIMRKTINDSIYCIQAMSEGAAGSTYTDYTYSTLKDEKIISANFVLRYPQCLNYDDPNKSNCQSERETFDLDSIIDRVFKSVKTF
ncbi:MAG: hypothetical protein PHO90_00125 [Candidatus Pacebacteria bacterium]|jgi:hypothetical protein|nr:hypothetical protein [Candidatus Paceibacterota bacterium]